MGLKSTNQSYIFNMLNKNNAINNTVKELLRAEDVEPSSIEEQLMIINKRYNEPLKREVLQAYDGGKIRLKYSKEIKLPTAMPFILIKSSGGVVAVISLSTYSYKLEKSGDMSIDPKKLYTLMESAYIALKYTTNNLRYASASNLLTHGSIMYANMVYSAINKKFNIGMDKKKSELVMYFSAKFFMINVLAKNIDSMEIINNTAKKNCKTLSSMVIAEADDEFEINAYTDISVFMEEVSRVCDIHGLNVRNFLSTYMQMYGEGTLLGLELFPYFMMNICSAEHGAFMNNQYMFENIIEKDGPKLYGVFVG
mgnify:CR=1 FL=1